MHWLKQVAVLWNFCNLLWTKISTLLASTEVAFFDVGHFVLILTFALRCERKVKKGMEWWALSAKIWNNRAEFMNILWLRRIRNCALSHIKMGARFLSFLLLNNLVEILNKLAICGWWIVVRISALKSYCMMLCMLLCMTLCMT